MRRSKWTIPKLINGYDSYEFERLIADFISSRGFQAEVTEKSSDEGIDVLLEVESTVIGIQAKRYERTNKVGSPEIRDAYGAAVRGNIGVVVIITTSSFTEPAKKTASELNDNGRVRIDLINGEEFTSILNSSATKKKYPETSTNNSGDQEPTSPNNSSSIEWPEGFKRRVERVKREKEKKGKRNEGQNDSSRREKERSETPETDKDGETVDAEKSFPWLDYPKSEWRVPCPECGKRIHNARSSFLTHWNESKSCPGPSLKLRNEYNIDASELDSGFLLRRFRRKISNFLLPD